MRKRYDYYDVMASIIPLYFFIDYYYSNKYSTNPHLEMFFILIYGCALFSINEIIFHRYQLKSDIENYENIKLFLKMKPLVFENSIDLKNYLKSCPICFMLLNRTRKKIILTKCNHIYCHKCWIEWSQENNECPMCRMPICFD